MSFEYIEHRKFPSPGECIYCGLSKNEAKLSSEHIIPFSLGGNAEILGASCSGCARVTSQLEFHLGRKIFGDFRVHANVPTRRKKERPSVLPATFLQDGSERRLVLPIKDHPYFTPMPVWGLPGLLSGEPPSGDFNMSQAHLFWYVPPNMHETLGLSEGQKAEVLVPEFEIDQDKFARALAKIAYCQAVVRYGITGFRRLVLPDIILGKYPLVPYYVGSSIDDPPPPNPGKVLHIVDLRDMPVHGKRLIVATIRLFANSGTKDHGTPFYRVVVGAPRS